MPPRKTNKTAKPARKPRAAAKKSRATADRAARSASGKTTASAKKVKTLKAKNGTASDAPAGMADRAQVLSSEQVFQGPLFRVMRDTVVEPTGLHSVRDVVRHNGSVVILAVDRSKSKKNPWIVMERQYRHAARRFLWELPAGKLDPGEDALAGAKRELIEETGYRAKNWSPLVEYWPSPGFLGESMLVYLAEGLSAGDARPEEDERIELRLVKLTEILKLIEKGAIHDGKTLNAVLLYAWLQGRKRKK